MPVNKGRATFTIHPDVLKLLEYAAQAEGISESEMAERSIRLICAEYAPHTLEVTLLDNGELSVRLARRGRLVYARRGVARYAGIGVVGVVNIELRGPLDQFALASSVRELRPRLPAEEPIKLDRATTLDFSVLSIGLQTEQKEMSHFLHRVAHTIESMEVTSLRDFLEIRCPKCGGYIESLSVWAPPGKEPEERVYLCMLGHPTKQGGPSSKLDLQ